MKTRDILTLALFSVVQSLVALGPAHTSTFAPNPCQPAALITPIQNTHGCYSFSATAPGTAMPGGYYYWDFGDGNTGTGDFLYHCYSPSTFVKTYSVTVTYVHPALCGLMAMQQSYLLLQIPPDSSDCVGPTPCYSLSAFSLSMCPIFFYPEMVFSYIYGDGTAASPNNTHQYAVCGNYILTVMTWDMNFPQKVCYSYAAVNVSCTSTPTITGLPEWGDHNQMVHLFPNPASDILILESETPINGIIVVDVTGREWTSRQLTDDKRPVLNVAELPAGTYFIKLHYTNGPEKHIKFIKQ